MKRYRAVQDYWYDGDQPNEFWKVYDGDSDEETITNGTPYSTESLYLALLELHGIEVELEEHDPV